MGQVIQVVVDRVLSVCVCVGSFTIFFSFNPLVTNFLLMMGGTVGDNNTKGVDSSRRVRLVLEEGVDWLLDNKGQYYPFSPHP